MSVKPAQHRIAATEQSGIFLFCLWVAELSIFLLLIVWVGAQQSRSPGAEQTTQAGVYQLPVSVEGLANLARPSVLAKKCISV